MVQRESGRSPRILCAGIAVLDDIFRVERFPAPGEKARAFEFTSVGGGCAANAATTIARLGGQASFAGPLGGPSGIDVAGDQILAGLMGEGVDCTGCVRVDGASSGRSAIFVSANGERTVVTHRDIRLDAIRPAHPGRMVSQLDAVLVDNRFPNFTSPVCEAARQRGLVVVLDADKPTVIADPLLATATHVIFSAAALRETAGIGDLVAALNHVAKATASFVAVTDGPKPVLWRDETGAVRELPVFKIDAVDTLAAGDVFHGAFILALTEGRGVADALRFATAAAGLKCSRFGGGAAIPVRMEVDDFLRRQTAGW